MASTMEKIAGWGLGGVVVLGGAGWWLASTRPAASPRAPEPPPQARAVTAVTTAIAPARPTGCALEPGQPLAFSFSYKLDMTVSGEGLAPASGAGAQVAPPQQIKAASTGVLQGRVLSRTDQGEAVVAVRMSAWTSDPPAVEELAVVEADLRRPYLLRVDARCEIRDTARHRQASPIAYARVLGLYDQINFTTPDSTPAATYTRRYQDDLGAFTAEFRAVDGPGRGSLSRRRLAYEKPTASEELALDLRVVSSRGTIRLGDSPWFEDIDQENHVEGHARGKTPLRQHETTHFQALPGGAAFTEAVEVKDYVWGRPGESELDDARATIANRELRGLSAAAALERFRGILASRKSGAWKDAQDMLRAWFKVNPGAAREMGLAMRRGKLSEVEQGDMALAMAKSGSDSARKELQDLAGDAALNEKLRTQAASALADVTRPTRDTVDTLAQLASRSSASAHDFVGSTATMSIGTLIEGHPGTDAAHAAQDYLDQRLQESTPKTVTEALWSVGNSSDPHFMPAVRTYAASEDADLRAAAAHAMRTMPPKEASPALREMMQDTNPQVVREVAESQRSQMQTYGTAMSDAELAQYATLLPVAKEPLRWELIRTLGTASVKQPKARAILAAWFPQETVHSLKLLIGQYLSSDDLTAR